MSSAKDNIFIRKGERKPYHYDDDDDDYQPKPTSTTASPLTVSDSDKFEVVLKEFKEPIGRGSIFSLLNDFAFLLENKNGSDVFVQWKETVKGKESTYELNLHSHMLSARSEWFKKNLSELKNGNDIDSGTIDNGVEVSNSSYVDGKYYLDFSDGQQLVGLFNSIKLKLNHFQEFVKYLYTGDCIIKRSSAQQLLLLAYDFEVKSLQIRANKYLERRLSENIDVEETIQLIRLAYSCNMEELQKILRINMKNDQYKSIFRESEAWDTLLEACGPEVFNKVKDDLFRNT